MRVARWFEFTPAIALQSQILDLPFRQKHTFDACAEWLRYVEHDRDRRESTVRDCRITVRLYLLPHFGADTPIMGHENITTTMIYVHHMPQTDAASRLSALLTAAMTPDPVHAAR